MKRSIILSILSVSVLACAKSEEQSKADRQYVVADGGLNMRSAPSATAPVVVLIPQNAEVAVLERTGDELEISGRRGQWTKVRFASKQGWVFGGFLAATNPAKGENKPDAACVSSLAGFTSGCLGASCANGAACGDKMVFRQGGVFAEVYCDGGSLGQWRIEGEELIAETESNMSEGSECYGGPEHGEDACKAQAARDYAGIVNKSKRVFTINPDGSVHVVTTIQRTGQAPLVSRGNSEGCLTRN